MREPRAASHRHGLAAADYRPAAPDWTIDQGWDGYAAEEHATWRTLFERQSRLLPGRACSAFLRGMEELPLRHDRIPRFDELSEVLRRRTGWQVVAVPGLVPDDVFFAHLAARRFPAGRFIRRFDQLDYLEEPDVFHDLFGHVPMLLDPVMAEFIQAYGQGGLRAQELGALDQLARVYWYTVEFGLVREDGGLRIFGAGIASSASESVFAVEDDSPHRVAFDLDRVLRTRYRIDDFQETYFVLDGLEPLLHLAQTDFGPHYRRASALPVLEPGELLVGDAVITRGSGRHHAARRRQGSA